MTKSLQNAVYRDRIYVEVCFSKTNMKYTKRLIVVSFSGSKLEFLWSYSDKSFNGYKLIQEEAEAAIEKEGIFELSVHHMKNLNGENQGIKDVKCEVILDGETLCNIGYEDIFIPKVAMTPISAYFFVEDESKK